MTLVKKDGATEDLHHVDVRLGAQRLGQLEARCRAFGAYLYLDELVVDECLSDLLDDGLASALLADLNHGVQSVT